ncbi:MULTISPECIES: DUF6059 family protein [Streptomyces]|uniref:DUF6059 family protein n=1 Tax=Streptomyces solicathayae TaxID=3081768 RepID=A0ABZ0LYH8_9ACTN|nr:DUF6059 family protein [Streptomyces sp. HUAS YS2]WOX24216.1 DUF6059 family protein [Streptomyces sp. HUAS YS2]
MRRSGESGTWLRRLWHGAAAGLAAVGQSFGAFTTPECYNLASAYAAACGFPTTGPVAADAAMAGASEGSPGPGHPERLVGGPLSARPAEERAIWAQLDGVWESVDP